MKKIALILFAMLFGMAVNAQESTNAINSNHLISKGVASLTSINPTFSGSGTENSPYIISTPSHLTELATLVNSGYTTSGVYFQLANNIDMSSVTNFIPIGENYPFSGVFNGNNHVISNLTITGNLSTGGLFGTVSGNSILSPAVIKNLGVENVTATSSWSCGGLVGYLVSYSEITFCYSTIAPAGITAGDHSGGLIGVVDNYNGNTNQIHSCYSTGGNVYGTQYARNVGGLVGGFYGNGYINNCYSNNSVNSFQISGGLIGRLTNYNNKVYNSYATGNVSASNAVAGGLIGSISSHDTIINCYYRENNVTNGIVLSGVTPMSASNMKTDQFATTLNSTQNPAHWLRNDSINDGYPYLFEHPAIIGNGTLANPYIVKNNSNLNTVADRVNNGQSNAYIAFYNDSIINGASNTSIGNSSNPFKGKVVFVDGAGNPVTNGSVTINGITNPLFGNTDEATINKITLTGVNINSSSNNVGALVNIANNSIIDSCYSSGTVAGNNNVGGLIGNGNSCTHITNCHSTANVTGVEYVGGLIGKMDGCSVRKSYAIGNVSGNDKVGGLLGSNDRGNVLKCYSKGNVNRVAGTEKLFGKLIGTGAGNEIGCLYLITATSPIDAMSNYRGTASATPEEALN